MNSFNPFQGLWNVLTIEAAEAAGHADCFNPFQGLWNVLTLAAPLGGYASEGISFNPFQGLWNVLTPVVRRIYGLYPGFNPFQGLWNVLTWMLLFKNSMHAVSIPFRDYGTFSPRLF